MTDRKKWMSVLAKAPWPALEALWRDRPGKPHFSVLRAPETGLVMVRTRAGGSGNPFNMGEATVTRCAVVSVTGHTGHAYILGRNHLHARAAAEIDALLQDDTVRDALMEEVIAPLAGQASDRAQQERAKTAATKVDFFTMVRGED